MVRPVAPRPTIAVLALALVGCAGEPRPTTPDPAPREGSVAIPDGGVARGHGAGDESRVRVPERDATPPLAQLRLDPGGSAPVLVRRSPVRKQPAPAVTLARPEVRATALIRDRDGGTGRIRLSVHWVEECAGGRRRRTVDLPPSQIERIRVAPGVLVPVERRRSARVALPRACRVTGKAFADATNASGLESFSDPVRFRYRGNRERGD
jgi:hypothetical protein